MLICYGPTGQGVASSTVVAEVPGPMSLLSQIAPAIPTAISTNTVPTQMPTLQSENDPIKKKVKTEQEILEPSGYQPLCGEYKRVKELSMVIEAFIGHFLQINRSNSPICFEMPQLFGSALG